MPEGVSERRRFARYPIRVPVRLRAGNEEIRSNVGDLSEGGLSFVSPRPLPEGSRVDVVFPLEDRRFELTGAVARCAGEGGHSEFRIGVAFLEPSERFRMKLAEQVIRIHELRRELSRVRDEEVSIEEAARDWVEHYAREFAELYE